jgi:DNA-binding NarL/FixJ family response regulator
MALEQAVEYALATQEFTTVAESPPSNDTPIVPAGGLFVPETGATLSPREVEVVRLLIAGATNPAIADTLVISRSTVKHHVASVLQKFGVATRTAAALRGRALGLAPRPPQ